VAKQDYYEALGVGRNASKSDIASAYRKKAMEHHPDRNPGNAEAVEKFKFCAEAFEVLNNDNKRAAYDRYGHQGVDAMGGGSQFRDVGDIFGAFGDILGDSFFGSFFGGGGRSRGGYQQRQGGDVSAQLVLDLNEAARGVTKMIHYKRREVCDTCKGTGCKPGTSPQPCSMCGGRGQVTQSAGFFSIQSTCPKCSGSGRIIVEPCASCRGQGLVAKDVQREVKVPAGVDSGTRLRIQGEGDKSPDGGASGDCYVFIEVKQHSLFHREGQDLVCRIPIGYAQAALGAEIEVPTLDGQERFTIPAGTQNNEVFTLRGRGMPVPRRNMAGDLHLQVFIEVPKTLNAEHKELLRKLAELEHSNVLPERQSFFSKLTGYVSDFFDGDRQERVEKNEDKKKK
jgi:molecular chaperone DnaJ